MIPLRDNVPSRSPPVVNYLIIGANVFVFLVQLSAGEDGNLLVERYGMVPARITHPDAPVWITVTRDIRTRAGVIRQTIGQRELAAPPFHPWYTLLTCIVLHGGWMHLIGNGWFLFIFGDNVEDRLGHALYLLFYLISGAGASLIHWATDPQSVVPTIGASGAIAGVMGAYFLLYPRAYVVTLVPLVFILEIVILPAYVFLGVWFVLQFIQGSLSGTAAGVAWWAHAGGFLVGGTSLVAMRYAGLLKTAPVWKKPARRVTVYRYRF